MACRPIGEPVLLPESAHPSPTTLHGRTVTLVPLTAKHAAEFYPLVNNDHPDQTAIWDYIPDGPYTELADLTRDFEAMSTSTNPLFFAIIDARSTAPTAGKMLGYMALMSIVPEHRRLEIGHVIFSRLLQRTTGATEAIFLLIKHSIEDLGYRRIEWKCNAHNEGSRRAALRIGFTPEGVHRQHMVVKGRNRDTAWFSILKEEWEGGLKSAMEKWLQEGNFDKDGRQIRSLEEVRRDSC
ncbi:acyl-CoA N-acyltransferase [Aspergillus californicus]